MGARDEGKAAAARRWVGASPDGEGRLAWAAAHSAYGTVIATQGPADVEVDGGFVQSDGPRVESPFRLLGQVNDEDAELSWTRFRCFDAESGTWISTDPLGLLGGTQTYGFDGSPTDVVDPSGLSTDNKNHAPSTFEEYMDRVERLDVTTATNGAVFYSGPGQRALAEDFAESNGRTTLEMTPGGRWLDQQRLFDPSSPLTPDEATKVWSRTSERFAENASGTTVGFVQGARPGGIFNTVEYPTLVRNPKVTNVITGGY